MLRSMLWFVVCFALAGNAFAQDADVCVAAFDGAQASRDEGKLLQARDQLVTCAQASCPSIIAGKCNEWLTELEEVTPSIVVTVEPAPDDMAGIVVLVDGAPVAGGLSGRPHLLDPGRHDVLVKFADGSEQRIDVVVAQGEQNRKIVVNIAVTQESAPAPQPVDPLPAPAGISPLVWVGFGIAGAAAIVGGVTGGMAIATANDVEAACGGFRCDPSHDDELERGETLSHVSTVSFAVAGAGIVVGVVGLFLPGPTRTEHASIAPWVGVGVAGLRGSF